MSKRQKLFDIDIIKKLINEKNTYSEILEALELPRNGGNYFTTLKSNIKKWGLDTSKFENFRQKNIKKAINTRKINNLNEILIYNSSRNISGNNLKQKLYKAGLKQPICELCGQDENWNGKKMILRDIPAGTN